MEKDFERALSALVRLAETRLPELAGHCVLPAGHNGLLWSDKAAQQAVHFFHHGCFRAAS